MFNLNLYEFFFNFKFIVHYLGLNSLLQILNKILPADQKLPKDAWTLLRTPKNVIMKQVDQGQLWYYGIRRCIEDLGAVVDLDGVLQLSFNFDGLPIYNSASKNFWPLLMRVLCPETRALVVGVWYGIGKPSIEEFLSDFVEEMLVLLEVGIELDNGRIVRVNILNFVCDTPARSFLKNVVGFNAFHGCIICTEVGQYSMHRMSFPQCNIVDRTDEDFRNRRDAEHHRGDTPLERLPGVDMTRMSSRRKICICCISASVNNY